MKTRARINNLNKRANKGIPSGDYFYWTLLEVVEDRPFDPKDQTINKNQGNIFLGKVDPDKEPLVFSRIKKIYMDEQLALKESKKKDNRSGNISLVSVSFYGKELEQ